MQTTLELASEAIQKLKECSQELIAANDRAVTNERIAKDALKAAEEALKAADKAMIGWSKANLLLSVVRNSPFLHPLIRAMIDNLSKD